MSNSGRSIRERLRHAKDIDRALRREAKRHERRIRMLQERAALGQDLWTGKQVLKNRKGRSGWSDAE